MNLLMVDNYDSFTYNIVQYLRQLGAHVDVIRHDEMGVDEALATTRDAIVISPGPGTPTEAGISVELIKRASGRIPLLGVCLGHQSIAAAFGGTIVRAGIIMHGKTSEVSHGGVGLFQGLSQPFTATRYHSLVVDPEQLPDVLEVTATTRDPDGDTIMAMRHRTHPTYGVQFHPESILTIEGMQLLNNFLQLAQTSQRQS